MTRPGPRLNAYTQALRRVITPQSVVLDIGCGAGLMALLAAKMGARKVYAIEPDPSIHLAKSLAADNGLSDRITFIQDISTRVELPEKADVIVSDLRGPLPLLQRHIPAILDARTRLLKPGGVLLSQRDDIFVAPAQHSDQYEEITGAWDNPENDLDLRRAKKIALNAPLVVRAQPQNFLAQPALVGSLEYTSIQNPNARWHSAHTATRAGIMHGLLVWFNATVWQDLVFSNAPGDSCLVYRQTLFLCEEAIPVHPGDQIETVLQATLIGDDYVWRWQARHKPNGQGWGAWQNQSSFDNLSLFEEDLRKGADAFVPRRSAQAEADLFILSGMNGQASVGQLAQAAMEQFPAQFASLTEAHTRVAALSRQYSAPEP
jgi:protein arginine N-methyltransferase 1